MRCQHQNICNGCTLLDLSAEAQKELKINSLKAGLQHNETQLPIKLMPVGPFHFRDRADLIIANDPQNPDKESEIGFLHKDKNQIFSLENCLVMSKPLRDYFNEIRKINFPIKKGSIRIRVGPSGIRGAWLDFANLDVKCLLEEKITLQKLLDLGEVEIGQKRKSLSRDFKLQEAKFLPWTETYINNSQTAFALHSCVGSFSQTGLRANEIIAKELNGLLAKTKASTWLEFGSGTGTLSFPLVSFRNEITLTAVEFDPLAVEGFKQSLNRAPKLMERVQVSTGDYQNKSSISFEDFDGVLVNPPRSGLGNFLKTLFSIEKAQRPKEFIYMSCHLDSYLKDIQQLRDADYELDTILIVDQFPHTHHFEILSLWKLKA